jgi:hypothetical protein
MHLEHKHMVWGILLSLFGVFFLVGNLVNEEILKYWPLFLIVAGAYKAFGRCCNHDSSCNR